MIYGVRNGRGDVSFIRKPWRDDLPGIAAIFTDREEKNGKMKRIACTNVHVLGYNSANVNKVKYAIRQGANMQCFDRHLEILADLINRPVHRSL